MGVRTSDVMRLVRNEKLTWKDSKTSRQIPDGEAIELGRRINLLFSTDRERVNRIDITGISVRSRIVEDVPDKRNLGRVGGQIYTRRHDEQEVLQLLEKLLKKL